MQATTTDLISEIQDRRIARELEEAKDRALLESLYSDAMATADAAAAAFFALTGEHISLSEASEAVEPVEPVEVGPAPEWEPGEAEALSSRIAREGVEAGEPAPAPVFEGPDPFSDDYYGSAAERAEDGENEDSEDSEAETRKYESRVLRSLEKNERATLYSAIMEAGGIETRDDLREEYRQIPNIYKRRDGLAGDEMADHLATYYPQYGIENENDLLDYFTDRTAKDRNRRVS